MKTALKANFKEEMRQAIREQDILELRKQCDTIYSAMVKANWNHKRAPGYEKVV